MIYVFNPLAFLALFGVYLHVTCSYVFYSPSPLIIALSRLFVVFVILSVICFTDIVNNFNELFELLLILFAHFARLNKL
jgi:hypothetical protein